MSYGSEPEAWVQPLNCIIYLRQWKFCLRGSSAEVWRVRQLNETHSPAGPRYSRHPHPRRWHFSISLCLRISHLIETEPYCLILSCGILNQLSTSGRFCSSSQSLSKTSGRLSLLSSRSNSSRATAMT